MTVAEYFHFLHSASLISLVSYLVKSEKVDFINMELFISGFLRVIFQSHSYKYLTCELRLNVARPMNCAPMYSGMTKPSAPTTFCKRKPFPLTYFHLSFIHCNEALRITIYKLCEANVNRSIPFIGFYYLGRQIATNGSRELQSELVFVCVSFFSFLLLLLWVFFPSFRICTIKCRFISFIEPWLNKIIVLH